MVNDLTARLALPLPAEGNMLEQDVQRLRDALGMLDTLVATRQDLADLVDQSPAALDTLRELAAAVADDPNFAANIAQQLANLQTTKADNAATKAALNLKADWDFLRGWKFVSTDADPLVEKNEVAPNGYAVQGCMELLPTAVLTVLQLDTVDGIQDIIRQTQSIAGNQLVIDKLTLRSTATLTVQGTVEVASVSRVFNFY